MMNKWEPHTRRLALTGLALASFLACFFPASCGKSGTPTYSAADPASIQTLKFHEGDATSLQHLDIVVVPQDVDGRPLQIEGTLDVQLWELSDPINLGLGDMLQEWTGFSVTRADFTSAGMLVKLPFHDFTPQPGTVGYLKLKLTAGGRSLSAEGAFQVLKESCCLTTTST